LTLNLVPSTTFAHEVFSFSGCGLCFLLHKHAALAFSQGFNGFLPPKFFAFSKVHSVMYKYINEVALTDSPVTSSAVEGFYGLLVLSRRIEPTP
jgi:hypothetical protein